MGLFMRPWIAARSQSGAIYSGISTGDDDAVFCPGGHRPLRDMPARPMALLSSEESL